MRTALIIILLFTIVLPSFAELTRQDVEQIIQNALESVKQEIATIKQDVAEMKGKMATKDDLLSIKEGVAEIKGKVATKDDLLDMWKDIDGKMDALYAVTIGVLIAIIVAILSVTLPPFLQRWLERRQKSRGDEDRLRKIEAELEELRNIREVAKKLAEEKPELAESYRIVGLL